MALKISVLGPLGSLNTGDVTAHCPQVVAAYFDDARVVGQMEYKTLIADPPPAPNIVRAELTVTQALCDEIDADPDYQILSVEVV